MGKIFLTSCITWVLISSICLNAKSARHGFAKYYDVEDRFTDCGTTHKAYDFVGGISMDFFLNPSSEYKKPICESTATVLNPKNALQITVAVRDVCDNCTTVNDIALSYGAFYALDGDFSTGQFRVIWDIDMDNDNESEEKTHKNKNNRMCQILSSKKTHPILLLRLF